MPFDLRMGVIKLLFSLELGYYNFKVMYAKLIT